jgi:hypothetical protein
MSRIPFAQISGDVVSVAAPVPIDMATAAALSGGPALDAIGKAGLQAADIGQKMLEARDSVNVSNALVDANAELDRFRGDLDRDPDVAGREAKFEAKRREVGDAAIEALGRRNAIDNFTTRFNQLSRTMQNQVRQSSRDQELQQFRVDLSDSLDRLATGAVFARSAAEREVLQAEADKSIVDAVRTGRMSALQAHQFKKAYLGRVDAALASELVRTNPGGAIAALGDPEQFKNLDAAQRVQLRAQATARSESLGVQARAELRADAAEFIQDTVRGATTGQMPVEQDYQALLKRAGPKSAIGVRLQKTWDFYSQVNTDSEGKSIPQLAARVAELQRGTAPPDDANLKAADAELKLTAQERALYQRHLGNVVGPGGVTNGDGSRSTIYSITREIEGRHYTLPTVYDGKVLSANEATDRAVQQGLANFPSYASGAEAEARYQALHGYMDKDKGRATPQDLHAARVLQAALAARVTARDKDPAAYVAKAYPTIGEQLVAADALASSPDETAKAAAPDMRSRAWAALLDAQRREGVPEHRLALLTHDGAEGLRQKFLTTTDGQQRADLVDQLRGQFGDHWTRVQAQLWQGKPAPADVQVIGALPAGAILPKVEVAEANKISDQQATELIGGKRLSLIDEAVRKAVEPMAATMVPAGDGPQFLATYQSQIEKLARLYVIRDRVDETTAARRAADRLFFDHWEVVDGIGGATVRLPKVQGETAVPASAVRDMQRAVLDVLPKLELMDPGGLPNTTAAQRRDMLVQTIRSSGYWLNTADDRGMVLMAGPRRPVFFADGAPLIVPFDSAAAYASQGDARRNLARRELLNFGARGSNQPEVDLGSDPGPPAVLAPPPGIARFLRRAGEGVQLQGVPR